MPRYQVALAVMGINKVATVQMYGDTLPSEGSPINIGSFYHEHEDDEIANQSGPENHVIYHHVRELLYKRKPDGTAGGVFPNNITDMENVVIQVDVTFVAVASISSAPATITLANSGTQQITNTILPVDATNPAVTYSTSNAGVATVSSTGLITANATVDGTATITVTTVDGGFTDTVVVTVA